MIYKELSKAYNKLTRECNDKLCELYDELTDEEKELISFRRFVSYYTIDYDVEYSEDIREVPKITAILRLKTIEELFGEDVDVIG